MESWQERDGAFQGLTIDGLLRDYLHRDVSRVKGIGAKGGRPREPKW